MTVKGEDRTHLDPIIGAENPGIPSGRPHAGPLSPSPGFVCPAHACVCTRGTEVKGRNLKIRCGMEAGGRGEVLRKTRGVKMIWFLFGVETQLLPGDVFKRGNMSLTCSVIALGCRRAETRSPAALSTACGARPFIVWTASLQNHGTPPSFPSFFLPQRNEGEKDGDAGNVRVSYPDATKATTHLRRMYMWYRGIVVSTEH